MHAASHHEDDADTGDGAQTPIGDASRPELRAVGQTPSDEPLPDVHEAPERRPIIGFFTRRAFFSKETGRWQQPAGARDHDADADRDGEGGN